MTYGGKGTMQTNSSKTYFQKAQKLIPGGVNSPVRACTSVGCDPLFVKKASGSKIIDVDNNEFIDFVCSWGPSWATTIQRW